MMKLLKYEFRKTILAKIIVIGVMLIAEAAFLIGLYTKNTNVTGWSVAILALTAVFGVMGIGVQSVITLHRDMNTRQGYMLFMTPNSCYRILGAKYLECVLSLAAAGAVFFLVGALDVDLTLKASNSVENVWTVMKNMIGSMNRELEISHAAMGAFLANIIAGWARTVSVAFFADAFAVSLLRGKKAAGITAFGMFAGLSVAVSLIQLPFIKLPMVPLLWVGSGLALILSIVFYFITAFIMQKKLSV